MTVNNADLVTLAFEERDEGKIARVTFNNPAKRNALGVDGKTRFIEVMRSLRHDLESLDRRVKEHATQLLRTRNSNGSDSNRREIERLRREVEKLRSDVQRLDRR